MIILCANNPMLSSKLNILSHFSIEQSDLRIPSQIGVNFFQTIILCTNNPRLTSKLNVLSHNSIPSGQNWKIHAQKGVVFFPDNHFEYHQCYVIFKIEHFVPYLHLKLSDLKNSFTNRGHFCKIIIVSTALCFFKIEHFVPYLYLNLWDLKNTFTNRGNFFQTIIVSTNNPIHVASTKNCF